MTPDQAFPATGVFSLLIDMQGTLWAGVAEGLISFRDGQWKIHNTVPGMTADTIHDLAYQFIQESDRLWMSGAAGLSVVTFELDAIGPATTYVKEPDKLLDNDVRAIAVDAFQAIWAATPVGLSILLGSHWYSWDDFGDLGKYDLNALDTDGEGWVYVGTSGLGVGRYRYDEDIDGITGASYYNTDWTGLRSDTILSVLVLSHDDQWFGTTRGAARHTSWETKQDWETFGTEEGLINNLVTCIAAGSGGILWFGTPEGASSYDGTNWRSYTTEDGLIHNQVCDIEVDVTGSLVWFATPAGISSFDGSTWTNYGKNP